MANMTHLVKKSCELQVLQPDRTTKCACFINHNHALIMHIIFLLKDFGNSVFAFAGFRMPLIYHLDVYN